MGAPGFTGMNLSPAPGKGMNRDAIPNDEAEKYFFHFPDGNASIARLLVRKLVPEAIPGNSATDVVLARADYAKLDDDGSPVADSTEQHGGTGEASGRSGQLEGSGSRLRPGRQGVHGAGVALHSGLLARGHSLHLRAIAGRAKRSAGFGGQSSACFTPTLLCETGRLFKSWAAIAIYAPGRLPHLHEPGPAGEHRRLRMLAQARRSDRRPHDEDALQAGTARARTAPARPRSSFLTLRSKPWSEISASSWRASLGPGGFDPAADITAITVNRWPHGYAYEYNSLWDKFWLEGGETPCEVARKPFGRIAIANADAGAYAYTDGAIDHAWRAVGEITKGRHREPEAEI